MRVTVAVTGLALISTPAFAFSDVFLAAKGGPSSLSRETLISSAKRGLFCSPALASRARWT